MKKTCYPLLLVAALLAGCHHDDERISYDLTGTYTGSTTLAATNPIAMYTKQGQVSEAAVITRFLARRAWLKNYFSATDVPVTGSYTLRLKFRANNHATILSASPTYTDSTRTEVTDQQPASFLLQTLDSANLLSTTTTGCNRTTELSSYIRTANPGKRCYLVPYSAGGYDQLCRARLVRMIGAHGSQLYVPYFSWLVQGGSCSLAYGGEWNTFNRAVLSHLVAGDTIVVQERELALQR